MSALFEFYDRNPLAFILIKDIILILFFGGLTLAWGLIGKKLGLIPDFQVPELPKVKHRMDENVIEETTEKVTFAINQVQLLYIFQILSTLSQTSLACYIVKFFKRWLPNYIFQQRARKKDILTSIWSVHHPNAGQNI